MENKDKGETTMENKQNSVEVNPAKKPLHQKIMAIVALSLCVVLAFVGGYFSRYIFESNETNKTRDLVNIIERVGYIFDDDGNLRELSEADYAKALVDGVLDDYSKYYTKEEYQKAKREKSGNYMGFGFSVYDEETLEPRFVRVLSNSPADKAGIKADDLVLSANILGEEQVYFSNSKQLNDFLATCPNDKPITLNLLRGAQNISVQVQKANYKVSYTTYFDSERKMYLDTSSGGSPIVEDTANKMDLPSDTALIKILQFEGDLASQLRATLSYMQEKGRTKLILDLRNNGGGSMSVLCEVAEQLIHNGGAKTLVAFAKGKTETEEFCFKSNKNNSFITNIVVLANEGTASASECLIGAMLHYGERFSINNLVVEKNENGVAKTYGKGIMQTTYVFLDGSALKLTTARIFWPDKTTSIHGQGILPLEQNATEKGDSAVLRAISILQG